MFCNVEYARAFEKASELLNNFSCDLKCSSLTESERVDGDSIISSLLLHRFALK